MGKNIIVIGSANTDFTIHSAVMPRLGETLIGNNFQINAGGKGLNQAVAIAKLGGKVSFCGMVGNDSNGSFLLNTLKEYGVPFEGFISESAPTGTAMITVVGGDNFIVLDAGANNTLTPEIISQNSQIIAQSDFCVLQLEIPTETVLEICKIAKENNTKVVLNPAPFKKLPEEVYSLVDYLIPNELEAEGITGIIIKDDDSAVEAVKRIKALGVKNVIITLGEKGSVYSCGDEILFQAAKKVKAVDTTSAGDCFIGAFTTKLSCGDSITNAIDFGIRASAIAVCRHGAACSIPFANEVEEID